MSADLFIGRVLSYSAATKDCTVLVPQLQGTVPIVAQAYLNSPSDYEFITPRQSGDRVLVFYDGGDLNTQAYWMVSGGSGQGGSGDLSDYLTVTSAGATYLSIAAAQSSYLSATQADATYYTKTHIDATFLSAANYYTQTQVNNIVADYLSLAGGTMSGYITLYASPTQNMHPVTKVYLDNHIGATDPHPNVVIALGTRTSGDYVAQITGTANRVTVTGSSGETQAVTLSLPQDIHALATPTFGSLSLSQTGSTIPPLTVTSTALVANLNAGLLGGENLAQVHAWGGLTGRPDPSITVSLTGGVTGSDTLVWTDLAGSVTLSIAATVTQGPGSGLDADTLDGFTSAHFLDAANLNAGAVPDARLVGPYNFDLTGSLAGNASTSTALQTPRTIAGKSFDGTADVDLSALTFGAHFTSGGTYDGSASRTLTLDATSANTPSTVVSRDASGNFDANIINTLSATFSQATGIAPLDVSSTTRVNNLNVQYLDGEPSDYFAAQTELESLLGDLMYVGLYDAAVSAPSDEPVPSTATPTVYRHAMYWVCASAGTLDFVDADLSGRYDIDDDAVSVANGDWVIAIDPLVGTTGHEVGTDLALSDMEFQYIPFSAETFVKSQIQLHSEDADDPHTSAGYLRMAETDLLYAALGHNHSAAIEQYISQHSQRITYDVDEFSVTSGVLSVFLVASETNIISGSSIDVSFPPGSYDVYNGTYAVSSSEGGTIVVGTVTGSDVVQVAVSSATVSSSAHPEYLRSAEAVNLYAQAGHNHDADIAAALGLHVDITGDPHTQYLDTVRGDNRYDPLGSTNAHSADPTAHSDLYYTKGYLNLNFEIAGAVQTHAADPDPHPQYLLQSEGDSLYSGKLHAHGDLYYTKQEVNTAISDATPENILATDGAASARIFMGNVEPASPQPGDLWIQSDSINLQAPAAATGFSLVALSELSIRVSWDSWPASSSLTGIRLQKSSSGLAGTWTSVVAITTGTIPLFYNVTGLTEATSYFFRVSAQNNNSTTPDDEQNWATGSAYTNNISPPLPTSPTSSGITSTSFRLNWTEPTWTDPGAAGARYEVALTGTTSLGFVTGTNLFYDFTGLTEVTAYQPKVRSVDASGLTSSGWLTLNVSTTNVGPPAPAAAATPTPLTGSPKLSTSWSAHTPTAADFNYYEVQVVLNGTSTVAASTTTTALAWTTPELQFGTSYQLRVRSVDNSLVTSAWVTTAAATTRVSSTVFPTASGGSPNDDFNISWPGVSGLDNFSGYEVQLYAWGSLVASVDLGTSSTSYGWTNLTYATVYYARIRVKRSSGTAPELGGTSVSLATVGDPIPGVSLYASGNSIVGTVSAPSTTPTGLSSYVVNLYTSSGTYVSQLTRTTPGSVTFTNLSYSTAYKIRAYISRTPKNGSYSGYTSNATTGVHPDTTPPALPTITSWKPEASYGRMVLRFTTSSSDNYQYRIQILTNGFPSTGAWTSVGNSQSVVYVASTFASGQIASCSVEVRDQYLNTSTPVGLSYTLAASPTTVHSTATNYWRNTNSGQYNADGQSRMIQGYYSTSAYNAIGMMYYGSGLTNACAGKTVTSMDIYLHRYNGGGNNVQDTVYIANHSITTNPGTVSGVGNAGLAYADTALTTLAWNEAKWATVPSTLVAGIVAGHKGFAFYRSSGKPYVILSSKSAYSTQGQVAVYHYG